MRERNNFEPVSRGDQAPHLTDGGSGFLDEMFDVLSDRRRRYVLYALRDADSAVEMDDIVSFVVDRERIDTDGHRSQVRTALHHVHLPKLADVGAVEYDTGRETCTPLELPERVASLVETAARIDLGEDGA